MDSHLDLLLDLPASTLLELGNALRKGALRFGVSAGSLAPFVGSRSSALAQGFKNMMDEGCSTDALARMCHVLHEARSRMDSAEKSVFPTLSGPEVPGTPVVSTPTMVRALFEEARQDVIVASYVFHQCADILEPLTKKMDACTDFRVRIIVDLSHQREHENEPLPIVANRFRAKFLATHWKGTRTPEFWHDPRVFEEEDRTKAGVMHAKVVIIDSQAALVTSANFTEAAQNRNIEAGVIVRHGQHVCRLRAYFEGLIEAGHLRKLG